MKQIKNDKDITKILFITLSNIGDAILTTPTLESLHFKYPNALFDIVGDMDSGPFTDRSSIFKKMRNTSI